MTVILTNRISGGEGKPFDFADKNSKLIFESSSLNQKNDLTQRRTFLKSAAMATTIPYFAWSTPTFANVSKNDRPRIGCIGVGGMGTGDARQHARFGDVVAVCDVDSKHVDRSVNHQDIGKGKADGYQDYRRVLERDDIDVVSIVTPDHWHVKQAIEALEAGKHVFCQKPLTLTLEENKLIRKACEKHKDKIFFVGTQQRSSKNLFLRAVNMVQKGLLGDIKKITIGIDGGSVGGPFKTVNVPKHFNWDLWQGPTSTEDYRKERTHGSYRWWYEYSGGKFTDWGAHHVDIATWAVGKNGAGDGPVSIDGSDAKHPVEFKDGNPVVDHSYNTSHDFNVVCKYADGLVMEISSRPSNGIKFEGTKGRIFVNRKRITGTPIEENWDKGKFSGEDLKQFYKGKPFEGHKSNFYRCIREGGLPVSDVFSHVNMLNVCHLSVIAARLGRDIKWDPKAETIVGDAQALAMMGREVRSGFELPKLDMAEVTSS